jgi:hypothetical protein
LLAETELCKDDKCILDQQRDVIVLEYIIFGAESKNFKLGKQFLCTLNSVGTEHVDACLKGIFLRVIVTI